MRYADILIIGSGIAGLSLALKAAHLMPDKKILVLAKTDVQESNSFYAQGGIAAVMDLQKDSFEKHIEDTLLAGGGLCDKEITEMVVREAPERIRELINWKVPFDKNEQGSLDLGLEGGHSENRILHFQDSTGAAISSSLYEKAKKHSNIQIIPNIFVIDLIIQKGSHQSDQCRGAYLFDLNNQKITKVMAGATVLATGGAGQIYKSTTNPLVATGDGIAIAARAGAYISHMEFVQFHPTALYNPGSSPSFLISEAVRGAGAVLKNAHGLEFMFQHDHRGSLAPRDVVARAIDSEIQRQSLPHVFLDARHISEKYFLRHFPSIYDKCKSIGINIFKDMIPVVPAAHYMCGGIKVDKNGKTNIPNLYACGECSYTGLHGANRLASNSLLEAIVFAHRIAVSCSELHNTDIVEINDAPWFAQPVFAPANSNVLSRIRHEVQTLMTRKANIVRHQVHLYELINQLKKYKEETDFLKLAGPLSPQLCELNNLITVSLLVAKSAISRIKPIGTHYITTPIA